MEVKYRLFYKKMEKERLSRFGIVDRESSNKGDALRRSNFCVKNFFH